MYKKLTQILFCYLLIVLINSFYNNYLYAQTGKVIVEVTNIRPSFDYAYDIAKLCNDEIDFWANSGKWGFTFNAAFTETGHSVSIPCETFEGLTGEEFSVSSTIKLEVLEQDLKALDLVFSNNLTVSSSSWQETSSSGCGYNGGNSCSSDKHFGSDSWTLDLNQYDYNVVYSYTNHFGGKHSVDFDFKWYVEGSFELKWDPLEPIKYIDCSMPPSFKIPNQSNVLDNFINIEKRYYYDINKSNIPIPCVVIGQVMKYSNSSSNQIDELRFKTELYVLDYTIPEIIHPICMSQEWSSKQRYSYPPPHIEASFIETEDVKCYGDSNGVLTINNITEGWSPYLVELTGAKGTANYDYLDTVLNVDSLDFPIQFEGLQRNLYELKVYSKNTLGDTITGSCKDSLYIYIHQPEKLHHYIADSSDYYGWGVTRENNSDGFIEIETPSHPYYHPNGTPPYTYQWKDNDILMPDVTERISALDTGNYKVIVTDANFCKDSATYKMTAPPPGEITISVDDASCNGERGRISILALGGGAPPYDFTIEGINGTSFYDDVQDIPIGDELFYDTLFPGIYEITASDQIGIIAGYPIIDTIKEPPVLNPVYSWKQYPGGYEQKCNNDQSAILYLWEGTSEQLTYDYRLESSIDPDDTVNIHIETGEIDSIVALSNIQYNLKVWDRKGCPSSIYTIQPNTPPLLQPIVAPQSFSGYNIACNGEETGVINFTPSGGAPDGFGNYYCSINNGVSYDTGNVVSFTNLPTGSYSAIVKDYAGCESNPISIDLDEPPFLEIERFSNMFNGYHIKCGGGEDTIFVHAIGGVLPYRFDLSSSTRYQSNATDTMFFTGIGEGKSYITLTDNNGCVLNDSLSLVAPPAMQWEGLSYNMPSCNNGVDGIVNAEVSQGAFGNYDFDLRNNQTDISYITLPGERVTIQNDSSIDISSLEYKLVAFDKNRCSIDTIFNLPEPEMLMSEIQAFDENCYNPPSVSARAVTTGGTPPYNFAWENSVYDTISIDSVVNNLDYLTYYLKVTDSKHCFPYNDTLNNPADTITISDPGGMQLSINNKQDVLVFGGNNGFVVLSISGGWRPFLFSRNKTIWQSDSAFNDLTSGIYTFYVQDAGGCIDSIEVPINEPGLFTAEITNQINVSCYGLSDGSFSISANGGTSPYSYSIDGGVNIQTTNLFSNLPANVYTVLVKDANNYTTQTYASLTQPSVLNVFVIDTTKSLCGQSVGSATVTASGGTSPYSYIWQPSGQTSAQATNLEAGIYSVSVTDINNCEAETNVAIGDADGPVVTVQNVVATTCSYLNDGMATISITGGVEPYQILWDEPFGQNNLTAVNLYGGEVLVHIRDDQGCYTPFYLNIPSPDTISVSYDTINPYCYGSCDGEITALAYGGIDPFSYSWESPSGTLSGDAITGLCDATYYLEIRDDNNCIYRDSVTLIQPAPINPGLEDSITICQGQTKTLDAGEGISYNWTSSNSFSSTNRIIDLIDPGTYWLTINDNNGCIGMDTVYVFFSNNSLVANFLMTSEANVFDTIVLIELSVPIPDEIIWNFPESFEIIKEFDTHRHAIAKEIGTFYVGLQANLGQCVDYEQKQITVEGIENTKKNNDLLDTLIDKSGRIFNAFPNPSEGNFTVTASFDEIQDITINIYNDFGKLVRSIKASGQKVYVFEFDLTHQPTGLFFIDIRGKEMRNAMKLIKL